MPLFLFIKTIIHHYLLSIKKTNNYGNYQVFPNLNKFRELNQDVSYPSSMLSRTGLNGKDVKNTLD